MSGSTLTVMLLGDDDFLYTASVGDSRALIIELDRKKKEILLSKDPDEDFDEEISQIVSMQVLTTEHNLNCIKEMKRV
jgi:serine/threonine protein phosphatase PrpC